MIPLDEATKDWQVKDGWKIAPAGLPWIKEGSRIRIGEGASIGAWASIGGNSTGAIDLGWTDGYRKTIACVDGVAYVGAGCRWFTLTTALKHWENRPDREMTRCVMLAAARIAEIKGWRQE